MLAPMTVSIHAPAWGATVADVIRRKVNEFQSTRPRGARRIVMDRRRQCKARFNPRARVGRDGDTSASRSTLFVSIHAPAWGATHSALQPVSSKVVSIHAPAWGATVSRVGRGMVRYVSIHAPAWGTTGGGISRTFIARAFHSTRPHGARQYVYLQYGDTSSVSIQRWRGPDARFESVISRLLRTTPNRETYGGT